ncbi:hypothetical protein Ajs_0021 [Acidovorax sp. JS42]|nr:hypothetical protein Ajs_0021 [Acidovorax sp. JS42]
MHGDTGRPRPGRRRGGLRARPVGLCVQHGGHVVLGLGAGATPGGGAGGVRLAHRPGAGCGDHAPRLQCPPAVAVHSGRSGGRARGRQPAAPPERPLVQSTLLVCWCPAMLMARSLPRVRWGGRTADAVVGLCGGVMGGIGGFTGVLPTLWCTLRGLPKDTQRAVVQNFNLAMLAVAMATYLAKGLVTRDMLPAFGIVATAVLVPVLLGTRLYIGISEVRFRQIVLGLLTLSGGALLVASVPRLLASA